jgi:CubicO group peptidase (beta-lactamase class C family)
MKTRILLLAAVLGLLWPEPGFAIGWTSRHGMTAAGYQAEFDQWTSAPYKYRLISVAGYEAGRQANYAAIWADESGPDWVTHPGMTQSQFESANLNYAAQDFYPVFLSGFAIGGVPYYNAIWHRLPGAEVVARAGLSHSAYLGEHATRVRLGYELVHLWTFNAGTVELFTAIWRRNMSAAYTPVLQQTAAQYQDQFNNFSKQGYQLIVVSASVLGGVARYSSLGKQPGDGVAWGGQHGLSAMNYQGESWNWEYQGYRPVLASVHPTTSGPRFNLIVHRNGGMLPSHLKLINDAIGGYLDTNQVPGMSVAISRQGELVYAKGFGQADQAEGEWVHPHHRFRIASVSKPITAAAILKLRDHCGLELGSTVFGANGLLGNTYGTPPYSAREVSITVTQMLQHTAGWSKDGIWQVGGANPADAIDWQLDDAAGEPAFAPGVRYDYMNIGFVVAARIIAKLGGKTYERFVQDEILAPSCVTQMEIGGEDLADRKPFEVVYYENSTENFDPYDLSPSRMDGNGGWIARPIDLLLFQRRIDGSPLQADILSAERITEMRTSPGVTDGNGNVISYGLGLGIGGGGWGHNGGMPGTLAQLEYRTDGFAFAVTGNLFPAVVAGRDTNLVTLKAMMNDIIDALNAANAWPNYDLFPCDVPPGEAPPTMADPRTFYVDSGAVGCLLANGLSPFCLFPLPGGPFPTVNQANDIACSGDRLFIRTGFYDEKVTFSRRMTIQSYDGTAVIGE